MKNNLSETKKIIISAFCLSLALIMGRFKIMLFGGTVKLKFDEIFYRFASIILGPIYGFVIAFLSEMLSAILNPMGNYIFLLSVTEGLQGFFVGLIWNLLDKVGFAKKKLLKICVSVSIPGLVTSFANSFVLKHYLLWADEVFWGTVVLRLEKEIIMILINVFVLRIMLNIYEKNTNINRGK